MSVVSVLGALRVCMTDKPAQRMAGGIEHGLKSGRVSANIP